MTRGKSKGVRVGTRASQKKGGLRMQGPQYYTQNTGREAALFVLEEVVTNVVKRLG